MLSLVFRLTAHPTDKERKISEERRREREGEGRRSRNRKRMYVLLSDLVRIWVERERISRLVKIK